MTLIQFRKEQTGNYPIGAAWRPSTCLKVLRGPDEIKKKIISLETRAVLSDH